MKKFTIKGQPQGKGRVRVAKIGKFAHAYTPEKTVIYENLIKMSYENAYEQDSQNVSPLSVHIKAFYKIPSMSKVKALKALSGEIRPTVKPDCDNISKCILDALNGIAYKDDNQVVELLISKFYAEQPRVEVEIEEITNG